MTILLQDTAYSQASHSLSNVLLLPEDYSCFTVNENSPDVDGELDGVRRDLGNSYDESHDEGSSATRSEVAYISCIFRMP